LDGDLIVRQFKLVLHDLAVASRFSVIQPLASGSTHIASPGKFKGAMMASIRRGTAPPAKKAKLPKKNLARCRSAC
jgi:hypothetical protein